MTFDGKWRRLPLVGAAALWMVFISLAPSSALALPISSQLSTAAGNSSPGDLARLQSLLEEKEVRQRLADLGFTPQEVNSRLARLSPEQLHEVAQRAAQLRVGGSVGGLLIAIVLIVSLLILILEETGHPVISR